MSGGRETMEEFPPITPQESGEETLSIWGIHPVKTRLMSYDFAKVSSRRTAVASGRRLKPLQKITQAKPIKHNNPPGQSRHYEGFEEVLVLGMSDFQGP